ncbi:FCD domain-containing protein [Streptomyces mirabilis]|uniref:FCD domain-containing protein n=1 Tax=Streptomyces mirabilis TaxID=68239 RepID=UPI00369F8DCF
MTTGPHADSSNASGAAAPDALLGLTSSEVGSSGPTRDLDAARLGAWRAVRDASDTVVERISAQMERDLGLPLEWYGVLLHIYEDGQGSLPQNELERHSRLSQSGISRMVSKMEQAGLLRRQPSERDRRSIDVTLTGHGRDVFLRATPVHHAAVQQHFGVWLNDDETAAISSGLCKVIRAGEEDREPASDQLDQLLAFGESVLSLKSDAIVVSDAIRTRDALEPLLLQEAARNISAASIQELREIVTRMSRLLEMPEEFFRADWDLHRKLAELSHNTILRTVYIALLDMLSSHVSSVVPTGNLQHYLYERLATHARIVDAVISGDEEQIAAAAQAHHFADIRSRLVDGPAGNQLS